MKSGQIILDTSHITPFIHAKEFGLIQSEIITAHELLIAKKGPGKNFLGWLNLPYYNAKLVSNIKEMAQNVRNDSDAFISIGIGGSYLGICSVIEAIQSKNHIQIYYAGHNIDSTHLHNILEQFADKKFWVNIISKSGTTLEPSLAFRIIKNYMEKSWGKEETRKRIIVTTDKQRGLLKSIATTEGYHTFDIPDDVGGRFSLLTPVGLLPIAIMGIEIEELLSGARDMAESINNPDINQNISYMYAAIRTMLYRKGKTIEILASFNPALYYFTEWWKQLFGESEGKDHKGIFPATVNFTTDLHSLGQYIQDGRRDLFETFLIVKNSIKKLTVPYNEKNLDKLNYLANKDLDEINYKAYQGTAQAHEHGGVPNMAIELPEITPYYLGQLIFFFEKAVSISGYMLGVNPFDQPGVEAYKRNMFKLLGK